MPNAHWKSADAAAWKVLKPEAQRKRHMPTEAEEILWQALRNNALGVRFRRQHAIGRFITDFCCLPGKLIVEVDGDLHKSRKTEDRNRDEVLGSEGFVVLRFSNNQVSNELGTVIKSIQENLL